jgi:tetratricopeptide (TPR) repeat protein
MSSPTDLIGKAIDLRLKGDARGAISLLEAALESMKQSGQTDTLPLLAHDLAIACEEARELELGISHLRQWLTTFPDDLGLLYTHARLLILSRQKDEAFAATEKFRSAWASSADELRHGWADLQEPLDKMLAEERS